MLLSLPWNGKELTLNLKNKGNWTIGLVKDDI